MAVISQTSNLEPKQDIESIKDRVIQAGWQLANKPQTPEESCQAHARHHKRVGPTPNVLA